MRQIGLFCGTFNPIHLGHLLIAERARDQFDLEKILFVTSPNPPHRQKDLLRAQDRHELVTVAIADNPHFEASDLEFRRDGPSYTIDTVRKTQELFGKEVEVNLLIGGDNLPLIDKWHRAEELLISLRLLVAPRLRLLSTTDVPTKDQVEPVFEFEKPSQFDDCYLKKARIAIIDFPGVAISSSYIREQSSQGRSVLYMVPSQVNKIMIQKGHYRQPHA